MSRSFGAVFVRINNPVFLEILREYAEVCPDICPLIESQDYDFEYGDLTGFASDVGCPESLDKLSEKVLDLISEVADDSFDEFAKKFREKNSEIMGEYSYVQWIYTPPSSDHGMPDDIVFTYGKDKKHNTDQSTTLKVKISSEARGGMVAAGFRDDLFEYFVDAFEDITYFEIWDADFRYRDHPEKEVDFEDESWDIVDIDIYIRFEKSVFVDEINKVVSKIHSDFGYHINCEI